MSHNWKHTLEQEFYHPYDKRVSGLLLYFSQFAKQRRVSDLFD